MRNESIDGSREWFDPPTSVIYARDRGFKASGCDTELESASPIIVGSNDRLDVSEFPPRPF